MSIDARLEGSDEWVYIAVIAVHSLIKSQNLFHRPRRSRWLNIIWTYTIMLSRFTFEDKCKLMGEFLSWGDIARCRRRAISVTLMKTNWAQIRQSVWPNRILSFLGTNVKNHTACECCMNQSLHTIGFRLREYLFEVSNVQHTALRAVRILAGIPILWITEEVKRSFSTHGKGFDDDDIGAWEGWRAT